MYIELRLKEIIESATGEAIGGHKLLSLWAKAKPIMKRSSQWFDEGELEAVEEHLREFCRIDPNSDAFRYSTHKNGELTLQGVETLDLKHLKRIIDRISTPFEGSSTAVYEDRRNP
jgi:hypothetical protein